MYNPIVCSVQITLDRFQLNINHKRKKKTTKLKPNISPLLLIFFQSTNSMKGNGGCDALFLSPTNEINEWKRKVHRSY
jgi:hypothetical protein